MARGGCRRRRATLVLILALAASAVGAWAFWSAHGTGSNSAVSGSLAAAAIAAPGSGINSVTVTWSQQAALAPASSSSSAITYSVERKLAGGSFAAVSTGGCSGAKAQGTTSCLDAPPATGTYSYRAVATYHTWTATSAEAGPVSFLLDTVPPAVVSIGRVGASPTNAGSVSWTVAFSEAVTGVDSGDFVLVHTGSAAGSAVSVSGSGASYTVTSATVTGDGTLGLNLVDDDRIKDLGGNSLGGTGAGNGSLTGQTFTIDHTPPTVASIGRVGPTPTNLGSLSWTVTFSEAVTGVDSGDFVLVHTGSAAGSTVSVSGSGTTYTVTSATVTGDGTLGLNLVDDDTIKDLAGNSLGGAGAGNGSFTGQAYTIDHTAPALVSMSMLDTDHNGKVDQVTATFNETLASSTNTSQWTLVSPPGAVTLASVSTSATVATLTLTGGSANTAVGSFTLALAANAAGIRDAAGNQASFAATAPTDDAPPVPVSVTDTSGSFDGLLQAGDTISATFSEPIASGLPSSPAITESRPATGNATLTIPGFALGSLDMMSADYLLLPLTSVTFSGTSALSNANKTITITGSCGLCLNLVNSTGSGTGMVYVPATTLLDSAGNAATGSFTTNFRIF
ncbi:MAG: hypothetical protein QOF77_1777 [Solirubrobacteraceae bacterium]|nr:hypothetical protein [Solirubrobacteraceae bacterium]